MSTIKSDAEVIVSPEVKMAVNKQLLSWWHTVSSSFFDDEEGVDIRDANLSALRSKLMEKTTDPVLRQAYINWCLVAQYTIDRRREELKVERAAATVKLTEI